MTVQDLQDQPQPEISSHPSFVPDLIQRYRLDWFFALAVWCSVLIALMVLVTLLFDVAVDGVPRLNWDFLMSFPSRRPEASGIKSALVGSLWLLGIVFCIALPIGISAGIFLEEFAGQSVLTQVLEVNINNLAGVPSIIYGLLGLQFFVRVLEPLTGGRSILAGGLTLSLLVMPIVIVATREAVRAVPNSIRLAGYAVGGTPWQVIRSHVLPLALPGILTGAILALSRGIGDTASLITIGALTYIAFLPPLSLAGLREPFTVLPIQSFNWISRPQEAFHHNAAATIVVLMIVLLLMNGTAILLRHRLQQFKRYE